ncbi:hypothetical protein RUM44_002261 [Polyplax serrata]|uniref:Uncharacterized protein n=1 Tax=Polyplax serrata TaxID=468196 RepID=A0ABR1AMC2_POLSC
MMNRNGGNVAKGKRVTSELAGSSPQAAKLNRKSFQPSSDSSSLSSHRNSPLQSEDDVKVGKTHIKQQAGKTQRGEGEILS